MVGVVARMPTYLFVIVGMWLMLLKSVIGEVASRDFGHEDEPFLCMYVWRLFVPVSEGTCMLGRPVGFL